MSRMFRRYCAILQDAVSQSHWDIICVTETHLLPHIPDSFVSIPDYNLFRHDTSGRTSKHGVCVYIHKCILTDSIARPLPNKASSNMLTAGAAAPAVKPPAPAVE